MKGPTRWALRAHCLVHPTVARLDREFAPSCVCPRLKTCKERRLVSYDCLTWASPICRSPRSSDVYQSAKQMPGSLRSCEKASPSPR